MLQRYREFLIAEDVARLLNSSSLQCPSILGHLNEGCALYLRVRGAFMAGRNLAQIDTVDWHSERYLIGWNLKNCVTFATWESTRTYTTFCIAARTINRTGIVHPNYNCENANASSLMQVQDRRSIRAIHYYTTSSLKLRTFARKKWFINRIKLICSLG